MNKNTLFTLVILISLCLPFTYGGCGGGGGGSSDDGQVFVEESFFFEVSVENHDGFRIQAISGSLEITGSPMADSVTIEGERRVGSDSRSDAAAHLPELEVDVTDLGTEVFVETIQPKRAGARNYVVDYRITVPDNLEVYANQVNGSVLIDTIDSQIDVVTINGDVDLVEIIGSTRVNVMNGQIVSQVTLPLDDSIELSTINGSIDSEVTLLSDGTIDITVIHGSINLDIPQNTSATFAAGAIDGAIRLSKLVLQDEVKIGNITVSGF
jgi:hypothetical protein